MIIQSQEMNFNYQMNKMNELLEEADNTEDDAKSLALLSDALHCVNSGIECIEQFDD